MSEIDELKAELRAIAQYWRKDWNGFDGRTLNYQINEVLEQFETGKVHRKYRDLLKEQDGWMT